MVVSYIERNQANEQANAFYNKAEDRFEMLLNIFKVLGHTPELGAAFTDSVMAMLKDAELDWKTKELLILKATLKNECQYCVVQHEVVSDRLGISIDKISDIQGNRYQDSSLFTEGEKALLDLTAQIGIDANNVPDEIWTRVKVSYSEAQIVEAVYVITQYIAISKFGDALGVVLEPVFQAYTPTLHVPVHG